LNWAIVIGIDEYGGDVPPLSAAVRDAKAFYEWVVREEGGQVPEKNVRLLLGHRADDSGRQEAERVPTKDAVMSAINEVMTESGAAGEKLFFFFAGHGIITTYANREESALATSGYDRQHRDETIAVRSIAEFFETTQFKDQFFFIDACRNKPQVTESEVGGWPIPRRRDPGQPPVQQFILYATAPGQTAVEVGWPDESVGAFSEVLMCGLAGKGRAKAWSWERTCYEVRWEALATYVKNEMDQLKDDDTIEGREAIQVPQDAGSRGVSGRDRDARLASLPRGAVDPVELTLELGTEADDGADLIVLDAIGRPVKRARNITGGSHTFTLPPRTYAARVTTVAGRIGRLPVPIEVYENPPDPLPIEWLEPGASEEDDEPDADGMIEIRSPDPLAVADIRNETGRVVGMVTPEQGCERPPGFYRVRHVAPEREKTGEGKLVVLRGGKPEPVELEAPPPPPQVVALAEALGGRVERNYVFPVKGAQPVAWAQPSTVMTAALGAALHDHEALRGIDLDTPLEALGEHGIGVALYAVASDGDPAALREWSVRVWPAGDPVPKETRSLRPTATGVAAVVKHAEEAEMHWLSIEPRGAQPTVVALPVLEGRLATLVAQVDPGRIRLYQFHPVVGAVPSTTPDRLRRLEHLQRLLLGGRVDGAQRLAEEVAADARDDPFGGCLAGYVLLRLGRYEPLRELASRIVAVEPKLSDAYILRGEYEAYVQNSEAANQAFAEAVRAGIPAFGEGLTRLVEGLRVSGFYHPRGALVRYIFQRHARGLMWAAFTPRRGRLQPDRLVITGADVGFEG
jgi:Caspase domain